MMKLLSGELSRVLYRSSRTSSCSARDNSYVRVLGTLKSFGERTYINATHVQPVKDMHEIYFHTLEAMTVSLYMKQGPVRRRAVMSCPCADCFVSPCALAKKRP